MQMVVLKMKKTLSVMAGLMLALGLLAGPPALAQQDVSRLSDRLDRLEASVQEIRAHLLAGRPISAGRKSSAPSVSGGASAVDAAGLTVKLADLEQEIRELTGRVEQAEHENRQLKQRIDNLISDTDHRLNQVESTAPATDGDVRTVVVPDTGASDPIGTGRNAKTKILGTIPADKTPGTTTPAEPAVQPEPVAVVRTGTVTEAPAPAPSLPSDAKGKYDAAFALLRARRFAEAEAGFQSLLQEHPKDVLAGNAQYWIGETHYARKNYEQAADAFLTGYKNYRGSSKGPDNLLKLGITLNILGQKSDACAVFDELKSRYGKASASIVRRMKRERSKAGC